MPFMDRKPAFWPLGTVLFQDPGDVSNQVTAGSFQSSTTFYRRHLHLSLLPGTRVREHCQAWTGNTHTDTTAAGWCSTSTSSAARCVTR